MQAGGLEPAWNLCLERLPAGVKANGGFAEYVALPGEALRKLPDNVASAEAVLCEPLACAYHAVAEIGEVRAGERVAVVGAGALGLMALQVAAAIGAKVAVIERRPGSRADLAEVLGAEAVFTGDGAVGEACRWSDCDGMDATFECAGTSAASTVATSLLGAGGRYVQMGTFGAPVPVDLDALSPKEARVLTSFASTPTSWDASIELVRSGVVALSSLLSAILPLSEWRRGFELARNSQGVRNVLVPDEDSEGA